MIQKSGDHYVAHGKDFYFPRVGCVDPALLREVLPGLVVNTFQTHGNIDITVQKVGAGENSISISRDGAEELCFDVKHEADLNPEYWRR